MSRRKSLTLMQRRWALRILRDCEVQGRPNALQRELLRHLVEVQTRIREAEDQDLDHRNLIATFGKLIDRLKATRPRY